MLKLKNDTLVDLEIEANFATEIHGGPHPLASVLQPGETVELATARDVVVTIREDALSIRVE